MPFDETAPSPSGRGSWQSRSAAALSSLTLRQISAALPPGQPWGLWASRQIVARLMDAFGPSLAGTRVEQVDVRTADGHRLRGEWVWGRGVSGDTTTATVYFVHGSGYALCSTRTHRRLASWLSRLTGLPVFSVDYRLAPRHRFPTAAEDVRRGWDWLTEHCEIAPERIVVAGDSAGGHLSVDLLLQPDIRHPAALVLLSPLIDLTFTLARSREHTRPDPNISSHNDFRLVRLYCHGVETDHPRLALDVATGRILPPTLIQAGGAEMLAADAIALAEDLRAAGSRCELQIWPDQVHVFQALPRMSPEAAPAMRTIAAFITDALRDADIERAC